MRVAVAGAGIGGLTLALALHARGLDAVICERAAELGEAGAGVQLGPNAVKVLARLGLDAALRKVAHRPEAIEVRSAASGRLQMRTVLGDDGEARWGASYLQLHRSDLQALLLDAVRVRGAAELRLDSRVVAADAAALVLEGGERVTGDALVGADGLRSAVAASLFGAEAPRSTGWTAWRTVVPAQERDAASLSRTACVWTAAHAHVLHYPVRRGEAINLVAITRGDDLHAENWRTPGDPERLRGLLRGWPIPVRDILARVRQVWRWAILDRAPRSAWSRGRATLLGDAAHPMPPFLAQGAAMSIEDAWVLAERLSHGGDVAAALAAYEAERRPRTSRVQAWSRQNGRLFHLPEPLASAAFGLGRATGMANRRLDRLYGWCPP